jgi:hypothetical protein
MIFKSRMRWDVRVAHKEMENPYKILTKNLKGRDHLEDLGVEGKIILEWILKRQRGMVWTGLIWLRTGGSGGLS